MKIDSYYEDNLRSLFVLKVRGSRLTHLEESVSQVKCSLEGSAARVVKDGLAGGVLPVLTATILLEDNDPSVGASGHKEVDSSFTEGTFDNALVMAKGRKKSIMKKLLFKNVAEFNGLLNKKSLWPLYRIKKKKFFSNSVLNGRPVSNCSSRSEKDNVSTSLSFRSVPAAFPSDSAVVFQGQQQEFMDIGRIILDSGPLLSMNLGLKFGEV